MPNPSWALTRDDIMLTADKYKIHEWTPTADNVCHTTKIDTPDRNTYVGWGSGMGWKWEKQGEVYAANVGVPYNWGGFDSLEAFDKNVANDLCAGNKNTTGGFKPGTAGVDCSGFVSRAWSLKHKESTTSLASLSEKLNSYAQLKKGDAIDSSGSHVMLCAEDNPVETVSVYEASANDWKVNYREYKSVDTLINKGYLPYTYFKNMDAEILMDTSGSMEGSSLANAKKAASQFVDFMNAGDKVGVSSFDSGARVNYGLTEIGKEEPSAAQTGAKAAIDGLQSGGSTAMGYGLQIAQGQLNSLGKDEGGHIDPAKSIILLSDGQENMSPYVSAVLPGIIKDDIRVCTIGLGARSDKALLKKIAQDTGCSYKYISDPGALKDVFCEVWTELSGQQIVEKNKNLVFPLTTETGNFFIDSGLQKATFYLGWEGSDMDLKLIAPDGTVLERATAGPDMKFVEGETYELFEIQNPMTGEWRYEIYGKDVPAGGEEATLLVSGESGLSFSVGFDKDEYSQGDRISVTASVEDAVLDIAEAQYVRGASFGAEVLLPDNHVVTLMLSDDGAHGDGIADDGIYGGYFENTDLEGNYNFTIRVAGDTNREGDPFTREKTMTSIVNRSLKPVAEANGPYVGYVGEPLSFSADGSYDSQGRGLQYRWDFDADGTFDREFSNEISAEKIFGNAFSGKTILEVSNGIDRATDAADVKVYGAKTLKEEAVSGLKSVSNSGILDKSIIDGAVLFISQSLSAGLWRDDSRLKTEMLSGAAVFDKEEAAALQLQILKGRDIKWAAVANAALVKLAKADEILVRVALGEQGEAAAGIESAYQKDMAGKILLVAQSHFVAARDMAAAGRYPEAIANFKTAWVLAVQIESLSGNVFASSSSSLDLSRYPYPTTFSSSQGLPCCQSA